MELSPFGDLVLRTVHDIFTAIWIGGMILYILILIPSLRGAIPKSIERQKVLQKINDNLAFVMLVSMLILFVTGLMLIPGGHDDPIFLTFVNEYATYLSIKTYLFFLMFILSITKLTYIDQIKIPVKKHRNIIILISSNIMLGIVVIVISIYLRYLL